MDITSEIEKLTRQVGVLISEERRKQRISIRKLKELSTVSLAVINDLEKGRSMPRIETLVRLCKALNISFNTFLEHLKTNEETHKPLSFILTKYGFNKDQVAKIVDYAEYIRDRK